MPRAIAAGSGGGLVLAELRADVLKWLDENKTRASVDEIQTQLTKLKIIVDKFL